MLKSHYILAGLVAALCFSTATSFAQKSGEEAGNANPILPGYYADPSIVSYQGKHYIYATIDPWGGEQLSCWESTDFKNWTLHLLNWPTKTACTSPTSLDAMVWAPSVVQGTDGRFYMHVSVGSEVWVGVADHPLGPWENPLGDQPMIPSTFAKDYHMIDAQAFVDDDGSAYLYWGSGWNWTNGRCYAAKLSPDMSRFEGEVINVTPSNFFEAPIMVKENGRYFLMYSDGKTTIDTYQVHYAVGDSPLGPFTEAMNSPILVTDHSKNISSPGHHTVFEHEGQNYILYHRHNIPFEPVHRQICVDKLEFTDDGLIQEVIPTHEGPPLVSNRLAERSIISPSSVSASSHLNEHTLPVRVTDDNYATRWEPASDDLDPTLELSFDSLVTVSRQELRPEFGWKEQAFVIEHSRDGEQWTVLVDRRESPVAGSPIVIDKNATCKHLRIRFIPTDETYAPALFEWLVLR
ncbi:family 43 glycosylhydrolase [Pelagicoccus sp. SDUM812003]|uniref:family 43 glycosylhydrolase n=1 Tax=Pelagicoccus sp. SDUM812003 TaxID=3041267 RepID=UPI00280F174F|nr:family 43 glycosylhydrolase [Pelagicoccus sp. SDUM812003]MDQ8202229.1 family 43 glycosylhydrolase [Pelagicoccus sp. SDUM812003]